MSFIQNRKHYYSLFGIFTIILIALAILSTTLGPADISFRDATTIVASEIPFLNRFVSLEGIEPSHITIVLKIRMPRIIIAGLVGATLAVVGAIYQSIFKNPMADPFILGVSSGASLGAAIAIAFGTSLFGVLGGVTAFAFIGALSVILIAYNIARVGNKLPPVTVLLTGVALSFFCSSITNLIMTFNRDAVDRIVFWTMGSFSAVGWTHVKLITPFLLLGIGVSLLFARDLNVIAVGDTTADNLGLNTERIKKYLLILTSLLVGMCVSVSGVIGFVGLVIPHMVRFLFGSDNRVVLPFSILVGAMFLIACDILARTLVPPTEIPIGVITALFGAPYFILLIFRRKKDLM